MIMSAILLITSANRLGFWVRYVGRLGVGFETCIVAMVMRVEMMSLSAEALYLQLRRHMETTPDLSAGPIALAEYARGNR